MTSIDSIENQKICVELAKSDINNLESSVYKVKEITKNIQPQTNTLDRWIAEASVMDNTTCDRYELHDKKERVMITGTTANIMKCLLDWIGKYLEKLMISNLKIMRINFYSRNWTIKCKSTFSYRRNNIWNKSIMARSCEIQLCTWW